LLFFFESYVTFSTSPAISVFDLSQPVSHVHLDHQSVDRSRTRGATVTKRRLARKLATRTAFRDPDISRAVSHKLRYAARRRGTLDGLAPLHLSESPPPKDTFSRGNEHKSRLPPISPVQFPPFYFFYFALHPGLSSTRGLHYCVMNALFGLKI